MGKQPVARQRARYTQEFKIHVVRHSLSLPKNARIKPTCRAYPGIEPVQIRKWIKAFEPLIEAEDKGRRPRHGKGTRVAVAPAARVLFRVSWRARCPMLLRRILP